MSAIQVAIQILLVLTSHSSKLGRRHYMMSVELKVESGQSFLIYSFPAMDPYMRYGSLPKRLETVMIHLFLSFRFGVKGMFSCPQRTYRGELRDNVSLSSSPSKLVLVESRENFGLYKYTLEEPLHFEAEDRFGLRHAEDSSLIVQFQDWRGI